MDLQDRLEQHRAATPDQRRRMTDDDVTAARTEYWAGRATQADLARVLGVGQTTVRMALMRLTYQELPNVPGEPEGGLR